MGWGFVVGQASRRERLRAWAGCGWRDGSKGTGPNLPTPRLSVPKHSVPRGCSNSLGQSPTSRWCDVTVWLQAPPSPGVCDECCEARDTPPTNALPVPGPGNCLGEWG